MTTSKRSSNTCSPTTTAAGRVGPGEGESGNVQDRCLPFGGSGDVVCLSHLLKFSGAFNCNVNLAGWLGIHNLKSLFVLLIRLEATETDHVSPA
jgi:hypothetical protein